MKTRSIAQLLAGHETFAGLPPEDLEQISGCARNEVVAAGTVLAREGDPAERFYVLRSGRLSMAVHGPGQPLVVDTAGPDEVVGWSWIFPPYRWTADVEAVEQTRLLSIDGRCLRDKAEQEPEFGYRLMKRFARVMVHRLEATQLRLLDLYGDG